MHFYFQSIDATWNEQRKGHSINDECRRPNAKVKKIVLQNMTPRLAIFALEDIEEGCEVRFDYGDRKAPWRQKVRLAPDIDYMLIHLIVVCTNIQGCS